MKEKVFDIAYRYLVLNFAFLPLILILRILEFYYLKHATALLEQPLVLEATGLLYDFRAFLVFALLMFIPFLFLSLINRSVGSIVYILLLGLLTLLQFSLIRYFAVNLVPLDDVLFRYSFGEIRMIINNSNTLHFLTFLPVILVLILLGFLQVFAYRIKLKPRIITLLLFCYLAALFLSLYRAPVVEEFSSDTLFNFKVNKSSFFISEGISYLFRKGIPEEADEITNEIDRYQEIHPEFNFTSKRYPLVHENNTKDVLGSFFNLKAEPPNLVFIIVESLSSAVVGEQSYYGNFTPFLDSLKNQSLYWDNFLSVSERTFHVFASIFGSLPFGNGEFLRDATQVPFHYSLIRYLKENGYFTGVYYGGDLDFTNYRDFFNKQGTDFLMNYFPPSYLEKKGLYPDFLWGHHDEYTFARSLEVIDSLNKEPRLDIYLTLSTHHPFHPPRADYYMKRYEEMTSKPGYPTEKKERTDLNAEIFSSVLYTDNALRKFFETYSGREDFDNTIFFITGDHFFMELGYSSISAIERYHVPMIIYSPLLKNSRHFSSVSSHQDITPSLIAMLQKKYQFEERPFVHWLGQGIDTAAEFRNINTIQFVTSDFELIDFLKGDYFLSRNRLYKIKPGLQTVAIAEDRKLSELMNDLNVSTTVTQYVNKNDRIILPELFRTIRYDTIGIFTFDTFGLVFGRDPNLFINLVRPITFDTSYWKLGYDLEFNYMIRESADTAKLPGIIVTVQDSSFTNFLYHQIQFPDRPSTELKPGIWYPFHVSEILNVGSIESLNQKVLKVYFFNTRLCDIRHDSLIFKLKGIN